MHIQPLDHCRAKFSKLQHLYDATLSNKGFQVDDPSFFGPDRILDSYAVFVRGDLNDNQRFIIRAFERRIKIPLVGYIIIVVDTLAVC